MIPSPTMLLVSKSFRSRTERRGIALVIVMVVVMMVALAAYGFNQQMTDAYRIGSAEIEQTQARLAMSSGIEFALAIAELPRAEREVWLQANPNAFYRVPIEVSTGDDDPDQANWTFSILCPADDQNADKQGTDNPDGEIPFMPGWVDESNKLNFWTLLLQDRQVPGHARQALLNLPGADPADVDAILAPFVRSPNKSNSLEDRLPSRFDPQAQQRRLAILWTGLDWDHNYRIDPLERALASHSSDSSSTNENLANTSDNRFVSTGDASRDARPWRELVTLSSGSRNENRLGQPRIHLNDSNLSRLQRRLDAIWDSERSRFVIAARQYGLQPRPANDNNASVLDAGTTVPPTWTPDLSIPATHRLTSPLDLVETVVLVPGEAAQPLVLVSPFSSANPNQGDYLEALLDDATLFLGPVIHGQVNVHEAPLPVLLGIPGMSSEIAAKIVRQREQRPLSKTDSHSVGWLLTENVLSLTEMKVILPWINAGGDCFTAQIVGQFDETSPAHRCTVTLDSRQRPAIANQVQLWHPWSPLRLPVDLASTSR